VGERLGRMQAVVLVTLWQAWEGFSDSVPLGHEFHSAGDPDGHPWWPYWWLCREVQATWGLYKGQGRIAMAPADRLTEREANSVRASLSRAARELSMRGHVELRGRYSHRPSGRETFRAGHIRLTPEGKALLLTRMNNKPSPSGPLDFEALFGGRRLGRCWVTDMDGG
jgi:hypothetical protein